MITVRMELIGARELEQQFLRLGAAIRGQVLSKALAECADLVLETAREKAPARADQKLRRSLFAEEAIADEIGAEWVVGVRAGKGWAGWYAPLIEHGTAPHEQPKLGAVHPGGAPRPFLRPAVDLNLERMQGIVARAVAAALERQAAEAKR